MSAVIRNEKGFISILLLILLPMFVIVIANTAQHARAVTQADADLRGAVSEAARIAASCVIDASAANGQPHIDPDRADAVFVQVLAKNLGLDEATLTPLPGSGFAAVPDYILVVYNGDGTYAPIARKYTFIGGSINVTDINVNPPPQEFAVSKGSITVGSGGDYDLTLKTPGVVAVVTAKIKAVLGQDMEATRWAAARIVNQGGP